jgi:hypothetical protein
MGPRKRPPRVAPAPIESDLDELLRMLAAGVVATPIASVNVEAKAKRSAKTTDKTTGKPTKVAKSTNVFKTVKVSKRSIVKKKAKPPRMPRASRAQESSSSSTPPSALPSRSPSPSRRGRGRSKSRSRAVPYTSTKGRDPVAKVLADVYDDESELCAGSQATEDGDADDAQALIDAMKRMREDRNAKRAKNNAAVDSKSRRRMRKNALVMEQGFAAGAAGAGKSIVDSAERQRENAAKVIAELVQLGDNLEKDVVSVVRNAAKIAGKEVAEMSRVVGKTNLAFERVSKARREQLALHTASIGKRASVKAKKRLEFARRLEQALIALSV